MIRVNYKEERYNNCIIYKMRYRKGTGINNINNSYITYKNIMYKSYNKKKSKRKETS